MCLLDRATGLSDGHQKLRHTKDTTLEVGAMNRAGPKIDENTHELIPPYQGKLINLVVGSEERDELAERASKLAPLRLSPRSLSDLELLSTGAFSPLDRFMGKADYTRVLEEMRLVNGALFPIPVSLPVNDTSIIRLGGEVALRSLNNDLLAIMTVDEVFEWDPAEEANLVLGTRDLRHPLVAEMASWGGTHISGPLKVVNLPKHYDFCELRKTPKEVRETLQTLGTSNVVAFQTRNPIRRVHEELTKRAAAEVNGTLLIHPLVGLTKRGDADHYTRVRGYKALVEQRYDTSRTVLSLLPLATRLAGPREALWHAIIARNYGANHFIVGRDHAGPGRDSQAKPFYGHHDARNLLQRLGPEFGVNMIPLKEVNYLPDVDRLEKGVRVLAGAQTATLSGTHVAACLSNATELPGRFSQPETAARSSQAYLPTYQRGFCVWFTGLSGAGKSTLAEILTVLLTERGREVTLLDGDVVRTHLSKGLGFSKEDRDTNVLRIGFVASEIVRHHGVVVCAAVSPYRAARSACRHMVGDDRFIEIYVATPLEVREQRDTKGMYARARKGEIRGFTGFTDSYEEPLDPEIRLTTTDNSPEEDARQIIWYLMDGGFLIQDE
jgi:sulfate adenylyltransferase